MQIQPSLLCRNGLVCSRPSNTFDPMPYQTRIIDAELDELLPTLAAIAVEGAKGVGKTATAERRATSVVHLDNPAQRSIAEADQTAVLQRQPPILVDE